jgi:hypothetical protein
MDRRLRDLPVRVLGGAAPDASHTMRVPAGPLGVPAWLWALGGYVVLAVGMTWPLALHLADRFPGENPVDAWGHYWNMWWFKVALLGGRSPYQTELWFAPEGADLFLHTLAPFNSALGLGPTLVAGPLVAYNLVVLATIVLAGQATFLLARHLTGSAGGGFVAGLGFAASPYLMGHLNVGHLNVAALAGLPLFGLALLRAAEGSRLAIPLAAGALLMTALSEWHTLLFAVILGAVLIGWLAWRAFRRQIGWRAPVRAIAASLLGGLLVLPLAIPTARAIAALGDQAELGQRWAEEHSANLLAYLLPQDLHPLWGEAIGSWREAALTEVLTEGRVSLGWTVLVLAVLGVIGCRWGRCSMSERASTICSCPTTCSTRCPTPMCPARRPASVCWRCWRWRCWPPSACAGWPSGWRAACRSA